MYLKTKCKIVNVEGLNVKQEPNKGLGKFPMINKNCFSQFFFHDAFVYERNWQEKSSQILMLFVLLVCGCCITKKQEIQLDTGIIYARYEKVQHPKSTNCSFLSPSQQVSCRSELALLVNENIIFFSAICAVQLNLSYGLHNCQCILVLKM